MRHIDRAIARYASQWQHQTVRLAAIAKLTEGDPGPICDQIKERAIAKGLTCPRYGALHYLTEMVDQYVRGELTISDE